ncbi:MAG: DUF2752 domain-containing protein [Micropruina sp.]|uniref:DUF2752 domain-containing protein n=1 Tax=Micropruina sp. TaxID=2737536 RepID=UPI0039E334E3
MTSERVRVERSSAGRRLRSLAIFGATGLGLSGLAATTGLGIPCPWRALTGTLCPFCGGTHVGMALLRGDLADAWAANQFVVVGLGVLVVLGLFWTLEALGGPAVRPPRALRWPSRRWWLLIGGGALLFGFLRNLQPLAG